MHNGNPGAPPKSEGMQQHEKHISLRPYITYVENMEHTELMWVFNKEENKKIQKKLTFDPDLYNIYDEILVNAAGNKQRDNAMSCIKIDIDSEKNVISIWNNGKGIPVVMNNEEKMYVPTMIFGHLFTTSTFNDKGEKVTDGHKRGLGAKLCNIFSTSFTVETASNKYGKSFRQSWYFNMSEATKPTIKDFDGDDFTKVTFSPDLAKFKMDRLDDDIVALMSRRAYDVAASTRGVAVYLNGSKIPVENFKDYVDLYLKDSMDDEDDEQIKLVYEKANERWEVAVAPSDHGFQQVSFVNSIATTKGGQHVGHVVDNIVEQQQQLIDVLAKNGIIIKELSHVRNHLWVFINCLIVNPTFDSQTKENMTLQANKFGSKCVLSEQFIQDVSKCGIVESIISWQENEKIRRTPKLVDTNDAGTRKRGYLCTLILTEGESAHSLCVNSLETLGRKQFGAFPLQGKFINVRHAPQKQIKENKTINELITIIGLQYNKKYSTRKEYRSLRYGKVMIMTDQDMDGSHITGLLINFFHKFWPELLELPFLEKFVTPLLKAIYMKQELLFFSIPEFEEWKKSISNSHQLEIMYYQGVASLTPEELKKFFKNMKNHRFLFKYDRRQDDENILMAFAKSHTNQRKNFITNYIIETKHRKFEGAPEQ